MAARAQLVEDLPDLRIWFDAQCRLEVIDRLWHSPGHLRQRDSEIDVRLGGTAIDLQRGLKLGDCLFHSPGTGLGNTDRATAKSGFQTGMLDGYR